MIGIINTDIAVYLFIVMQFILGDADISVKKVLCAFIGWEAFGNSNWYIFAILCMYISTFISFVVFKNNKYLALAFNLLLIGVYVFIMHEVKDIWWYDTVLCYFAGMIFYVAQPLCEKIVRSGKFVYWVLLAAVLVLLLFGIKFRMNMYFLFIKHILFAGAVVLITMKFGIHNKILNFCGKHLFSIYILQRLPMIVFSKLGIDNKYIFVILSFAATILLCIGFDKVMSIIDGRLFKKKTA